MKLFCKKPIRLKLQDENRNFEHNFGECDFVLVSSETAKKYAEEIPGLFYLEEITGGDSGAVDLDALQLEIAEIFEKNTDIKEIKRLLNDPKFKPLKLKLMGNFSSVEKLLENIINQLNK